mmetsp:Transcript_3608/g.4660  ORF Transcript_3608/g.4660 Transcript_3608/m.4660 type:complete len:98 (+) Transcript_3608:203-496(+)
MERILYIYTSLQLSVGNASSTIHHTKSRKVTKRKKRKICFFFSVNEENEMSITCLERSCDMSLPHKVTFQTGNVKQASTLNELIYCTHSKQNFREEY